MRNKSAIPLFSIAATCLISAAYPGVLAAQTPGSGLAGTAAGPLTYADLTDLSDASSLVAVVRIRSIIALPPERAGTVPQGYRRLYIEADVDSLIRGDGGISPSVRYLYDAPVNARGKLPKLKKARMILFATRGARPGDIQLVARDAQIPADPATVEQVKAILSGLVANGAPPRITGVGDAFHVKGTVAGESETQIFLRTENGDPVSLSILRRPGQQPRWAVALGEIVDEAAAPPAPGSLLWYRLACSLPAALPAPSVRALAPGDADAARADYALVMQALGPCERRRTLP
ncbi:putative uncharacterized protein precursor [Sphingomonas paucimobilis]|nr:putative uncharacterized protein precursor [Sphingomonas paucimobilis]